VGFSARVGFGFGSGSFGHVGSPLQTGLLPVRPSIQQNGRFLKRLAARSAVCELMSVQPGRDICELLPASFLITI
jgi:hypothetical protein